MYIVDGKPVMPDYGRKNPGISRLEYEQLKQDVSAIRAELEALKKPVDVIEDIEELKAEAIELGIEVKGNWGAKRIKQAIDDAKAE